MNDHHTGHYPGNGFGQTLGRHFRRAQAEGVASGPAIWQRLSELLEEEGLAEPFKGVTTNGVIRPDLYPIRTTGVSTEAVRQAAAAFLDMLTPAQRQKVLFAVDDIKWRKWMNIDPYVRHSLCLEEMSPQQREAALSMMAASLSAKGFELSRDIMRLNLTLGELNDDHEFAYFGEWKYWMAMMGIPSKDKPWGWQIDGHHLIINYFVLGDQVVMTPAFMGTEPAVADSGRYQGVSVLQVEQDQGLAMMRALSEEQRQQALLHPTKADDYNLGEAFKDNLVLDYAGIPASTLSIHQQTQLLQLIQLYVDNMAEGHAKVKMEEVAQYIHETHFAWIGGTEPDAVFYYRIQSPVILVEFDHQFPIGLNHILDSSVPTRQHIHTVVRTPNGNDYGKDLLRQHYELHPH